MMRRRVIEANDAADDRRRFAASAMPENLVAIADQLAGRVEQFHCGHSRGADQTMALAARDQRKVSGPQVTGVRALDFEPALPGGGDVEHHARLERRKRERPRRPAREDVLEER